MEEGLRLSFNQQVLAEADLWARHCAGYSQDTDVIHSTDRYGAFVLCCVSC